MPEVARLAMPITFVVGAHNQIFLPEGTERTIKWLTDANGPGYYDEIYLHDYAHLDAFVGTRAGEEVFPRLLGALERAPIDVLEP
jgi:cholesterol oxidase